MLRCGNCGSSETELLSLDGIAASVEYLCNVCGHGASKYGGAHQCVRCENEITGSGCENEVCGG